MWLDRSRPGADVKALAPRELKRKATRLDAMRRTLEALANAGDGDERPDCPILDDPGAFESDSGRALEPVRMRVVESAN